jgi:hypothetical protein
MPRRIGQWLLFAVALTAGSTAFVILAGGASALASLWEWLPAAALSIAVVSAVAAGVVCLALRLRGEIDASVARLAVSTIGAAVVSPMVLLAIGLVVVMVFTAIQPARTPRLLTGDEPDPVTLPVSGTELLGNVAQLIAVVGLGVAIGVATLLTVLWIGDRVSGERLGKQLRGPLSDPHHQVLTLQSTACVLLVVVLGLVGQVAVLVSVQADEFEPVWTFLGVVLVAPLLGLGLGLVAAAFRRLGIGLIAASITIFVTAAVGVTVKLPHLAPSEVGDWALTLTFAMLVGFVPVAAVVAAGSGLIRRLNAHN